MSTIILYSGPQVCEISLTRRMIHFEQDVDCCYYRYAMAMSVIDCGMHNTVAVRQVSIAYISWETMCQSHGRHSRCFMRNSQTAL